jgi:predicted metal-dependent HD superfamily phosphohydrolase
MTTDELERRWPLPDHDAERDALLAAYRDAARGYHDTLHLTEVLDRLEELAQAGVADDGPEVRLAAWFHDAVYDGLRGDEDRSAIWAEDALAATPYADEVARLVRLTEHHDAADDDAAGQMLCDADLAILAAEAPRYDAYVAGVRRDYAQLSDDDFAAGRAAVLRDLLAKPALFGTPEGRRRWERRARSNVEREIDRLSPRPR